MIIIKNIIDFEFSDTPYLESKELSIDEIAYLVGYTEISSFYRAFKSWTGKTVLQYQKEKE